MSLLTIQQDKTFDWRIEDNRFKTITDVDAIIQRIKNKILLWTGEWFIDLEAGFDWEDVLSNPPDEEILNDILKAYIQNDEFIDIVTELNIKINRATRKTTITLSAITADGDPINDITITNIEV